MTLPASQKQYQFVKAAQGFTLELADAPVKAPGDNDVVIQIKATALNRRDISIMQGFYPVGDRTRLVPLSDGAGEVVAVGAKVKRFKQGDRVTGSFFQTWLGGRPTPAVFGGMLGGSADGLLTQYATLNEEGVVALPENVSYEEGATLTCAATTAWRGLVTHGGMQSGDFVLVQGTGGVAMFGVQFAAASGAKPIVTSSSDDKIARAKKLGAVAGVNYKTTPDWEKGVAEATGGRGVDQILELGGSGTLAKSLASIAMSGHIALIGAMAGFGGDLPAAQLIGRNATTTGILVGSRADLEAAIAFIAKHKIKPVVDRVFEFKDAPAAFDYMNSGQHFGKVVIKV